MNAISFVDLNFLINECKYYIAAKYLKESLVEKRFF